MASSAFPTPAPAASATPAPPRPVTTEQEQLLQDTIDYLERPDFELPTTLKVFKAYTKARGHPTRASSQHNRDASAASQASTSTINLKDVELQPLSDVERCWLSREQLLRFLRAVKWDFKAVIARIEETLIWRREFGVDKLTADDVSVEGETGKQLILGFDNNARPCYHMYPYRQNTKYSPRQIQFVVWYLETSIDLMGPEVETLCLCIDFGADLSTGGGQPTSLGAARTVLYILQTYYAERLGRAICVNVPFLFWTFYKLVGPWVDPVTKEKIVFTRQSAESRDFVPVEQLESKRFGGELQFDYKHDEYFPALAKLAAERRAATFANWQKQAEGRIGFSERLTRVSYASPSSLPNHVSSDAESATSKQLHVEPSQALSNGVAELKLDETNAAAATATAA